MADATYTLVTQGSPTAGDYYYLPAAAYNSVHNGWCYDYATNTIYVPVAWYNGSVSPYNAMRLYKSTTGGASWTYDTLATAGSSYNFRTGGAQVWRDGDGYIYIVFNRGFSNNPNYETHTYIAHNRTGSWTVTLLTGLWGAIFNGSDYFYSSVDSYIWPHGDGSWNIWIAGSFRTTGSVYTVKCVRWNTVSGLSAVETLTGAGNVWAAETMGRAFFGGIEPHPTTGLPIIVHDATHNTSYTKVISAMRNGDGSWSSLGDISHGAALNASYGRIQIRTTLNSSGHYAEVLYVYTGVTGGYTTASHPLTGASWTLSSARTTYTRYNGTSSQIVRSIAALGANYEDNVRLICPNSSTHYVNLPPHTNPATQYETQALGSSFGICGEYFLGGPMGQANQPHQRFTKAYAYPYTRTSAGSTVGVYFFVRDQTQFYSPIAIKVWKTGAHTLTQSVLLGLTTLVDGNVFPDTGGANLLHWDNSGNPAVYQKIQVRNDLPTRKFVKITFESSKGTPLLCIGTPSDTPAIAMGYTYTNNWVNLDFIEPGASAYYWVKWTPPANYQTVAVGAVSHKIIRRVHD